jgi:enoyl-CoA hydratase/carnithine racemase
MTSRKREGPEMSRRATSPDVDAATVLREDREGVAVVVLNRPEARNALSDDMLAALGGVLASLREDNSIRAVVLASNGPAFCAGHDLKEATAHRNDRDRGRAYFQRNFETSASLMQALVDLPQPVIAAVQGMATAAGCQLVAACDLIVASEAARFCTPGVDIGLFCAIPAVPLSRKVAPGHALEMLLTGEPIGAERAREIGLVNRVVPLGREREEAIALARVVASKSSYVQRIGKESFYQQRELPLAEAFELTTRVMTENMMARDAEEGIGAFVEKRTPKWEDR